MIDKVMFHMRKVYIAVEYLLVYIETIVASLPKSFTRRDIIQKEYHLMRR
jgi:hypothetical protein